MDRLWTWGGECFGYRDGDDLWTHDGRHVARFVSNEVYGPDGRYIGETMNDNRLIGLPPEKWSSLMYGFAP